MHIHRLVSLSYIVAAALVIGGCVEDAPHDNPLDPQSPHYTGTGSFSGKVALLNLPESGVAAVRISTIPSTVTIVTDSSGNFQFSEIPAGTYDIVASKNLFIPDTLHVSIGTGGRQTVVFAFNGYPEVVSVRILTRKIDQWYPNPAYFAEITADITDPNGIADLDSAWFSVDSILFPLTYSVTDKNFQLTITSYQLPSNNLEWLVGKPLTVIARDRENSSSISAPFYVTRTIEQEASPNSPAFQDTTSSSPLLLWTPPDVRFVYTYSLSIVRVDNGSEFVVWSQDNIGNHLLTYQYPSILARGNYFWTIAVVDEYGNYARSKESSFVVN